MLLGDNPEARVTQLQTLRDLAQDVQDDEVYLSVTKNVVGRPQVSKGTNTNENVLRNEDNRITY